MKIITKLKNNFMGIKKGFYRFPITLIFSLVFCAISIKSVDSDVSRELLMIISLGTLVSLVIGILVETYFEKNKIMGVLLYLLEIINLYFLYKYFKLGNNSIIIQKYIGLFLIFGLASLFLAKVLNFDEFDLYVIDILKCILVAWINAFVLMLGIFFIIFTINTLFDIEMGSKIYSYTYIIIYTVFFTGLFLSRFPDKDKDYEGISMNEVFEKLFSYIIIPLITIYTFILYVFFIKILIKGEWPEGIVSHLVLWYSIVGIIVLFFTKSIVIKNKIVNQFRKYYPILNLVNLALMFYAIYIRISNYGFTINRYYVLMGGIWVLLMDIFYIYFKEEKNIIVPLSLSLIITISIMGPLSSFNVSLRSQSKRLEKLFGKYSILNGQELNKTENIDREDLDQMQDILIYLHENYGLDNVKFLGDISKKKIEDALNIEIETYYNNYKNYEYVYFREENEIIGLNGYEYMIQTNFYENKTYELKNVKLIIKPDYKLEIQNNEKAQAIDLEKELNNQMNLSKLEENEDYLEIETLDFKLKINIVNLSGQFEKSDDDKYVDLSNLEVRIFIK